MSSSLNFSSLSKQPAALAVGAALGVGVSLLATHALSGWCPFVSGSKGGACRRLCSGKQQKKPLIVAVTGAAGQIGYAILFQIAQGRMLGCDQPVELRLLDLPNALQSLHGVSMELEDCAFPLLTKVVCTDDPKVAFENCDVALLIGARPRGPGMTRADLLKANADIFKKQGKALNDHASRNVKVLVVGNPANTNCKIAMEHAPDLPKTAWTAMTRLDQLRATAQLAKKVNGSVRDVKNVIVWGNHSETMYPDISFATVDVQGRTVEAAKAADDDKWVKEHFLQVVQSRGGAIIEARKMSSAASAANAAVEHVRSWFLGTKPGEYVSMAVCSNGEYGVPAGLIFSFPCTCVKGEYKIVEGLKISDFSREKMKVSWEQLAKENQDWRGDASSSN